MKKLDNLIRHRGGCHCGAVKYEVEAPEIIEATLCNYSICSKSGYLHLIVPASRFHLLQGADNLTTYTFDTHEAKHLFCKTCGIKSYYVPRSNPDGFSINVRCLEPNTIKGIDISNFDGRNWEANAHTLAHLSKEFE
jgi:hypothetical protein